jgi:hypothetical protein
MIPTDMDVDGQPTSSTTTSIKKPNRGQNDRKTKNQRARKPRNSMTFPTSRGKGALKPFTGKGRVSKRSSK